MLLPPFKIYEAMRSLACEQQKRLDPKRVEAQKIPTQCAEIFSFPLTSTGAAEQH
jgi:hypothetical protein